MERGISKILDISWRFGVTAASNDSDNVAKSFLQLKLCLEEDGKVKNVFTEMTIGQFYKFLHDLEKAALCLSRPNCGVEAEIEKKFIKQN